ncbi:MAG TPA: pseudouridine synthase [Anaerolineae bacterium]|nr:pseudouridine synthase [Anaerolineae bacterium]HQH39563.1 pseudouridine synthase [Anaerolineae bacterium]
MENENAERLQKILANAGYGSRRACEEMIEAGRVTVDGRIAHVGDKADPTTQRITLDDVPIRRPQAHTYVMIYKPRGYITTTDDPAGRKTIMDLIPLTQRLYPVGRLDADSEGLVLLTDDGELTERLTHPRYGHARVYRVLVTGEPSDETLERWRRGITLDGKRSRFSQVTIEHQEREQTWLRVTIHEGRKHLVRRITAALGHPAQRLIRVEMGALKLGDLTSGRWRYLREGEVNALRQEAGLGRQASESKRPPRGRPASPRPATFARRRPPAKREPPSAAGKRR